MAVAIALSPFAVIPAVLLLLADDPRRMTGSFLAGWFGGVAIATTVAVLFSDVIDAWEAPAWLSWLRGAVAVLLVILGIRGLVRRPDPDGGGWADRLAGATPRRAVRLGAVLSLANPKVLLLAASGGLAIGAEGWAAAGQVVAVAVFAVVASIGVGGPLLLHVGLGSRAEAPLRALEAWLARYGDRVMGIVLLVLGGYLLLSVLA